MDTIVEALPAMVCESAPQDVASYYEWLREEGRESSCENAARFLLERAPAVVQYQGPQDRPVDRVYFLGLAWSKLAERANQMRSILCVNQWHAPNNEDLRVLSIGGGPGSDAFGALPPDLAPERRAHISILDIRAVEWERHVGTLLREHLCERVRVSWHPCDVHEEAHAHVGMPESHLVTVSYLFSSHNDAVGGERYRVEVHEGFWRSLGRAHSYAPIVFVEGYVPSKRWLPALRSALAATHSLSDVVTVAGELPQRVIPPHPPRTKPRVYVYVFATPLTAPPPPH
eukprot:TRINITY_DN10799_c0_g1_i1.p1 TRINITY_DN10799_c0_g1~~TRINITY_DN10799_c0_g1_i1.p1  ORF type:complete len:286 (-),score=52.59 TRINITY_DN10799_c0_g1_i1:211-1068(-)